MNRAINPLPKQYLKEAPPAHPLAEVSQYGLQKAKKTGSQSFGLSIFAGAFIAIAFVFYITVTTGSALDAWGLTRLAGGFAFSLGLILVVVCGAELFTSTVLSSVAWAQGKIKSKHLLVIWSRVYLGNFIGAMLILSLVYGAQLYQLDQGSWGINLLHVAQHKIHHSWGQAFSLGVLCNLLVCLGIWMTFSSRDVLTKAFLLMLPVAMFVSTGFEHSIANLFMVPMGIVLQNTVSPEYLAAFGFTQQTFADLTISNFIFNNLIPVTLGNIVGGGVMVGLGYWSIYRDVPQPIAQVFNQETHIKQQNMTKTIYVPSPGEKTMNNTTLSKLTVTDLMDKETITLTEQETANSALAQLAEHKVRGAVVINEQQQLVGFVSEQDLLRSWWGNDFELDETILVADVMQHEVLSVTPEQSIAELVEFMTVDKSILYPVSDSGVMLSSQYTSYTQRLNKAAAQRPSIYPVIENGIVIATISRQHISEYLLAQIAPQPTSLTPVETEATIPTENQAA